MTAECEELRNAALEVMMKVRTVTTDGALDDEIASHSDCAPDCLQLRIAVVLRDIRIALGKALEGVNS